VTKPGNPNTQTKFSAVDAVAHGIDNTNDLMTRHERKLWIVEVAIDNVKISSTDGTSLDLDPQLARARPWITTFDERERFPDFLKNHCFHS